jgi:hypothetical protein
MNTEEFWRAVEGARAHSRNDIEFYVRMRCRTQFLTVEGARQYYKTYAEIESRAHSYRLWGAAYIINNGCGDDDFFAFIAWLISQGRHTFERVIADPDILAEYSFPKSGTFMERFELLAIDTYRRKTGQWPDRDENANGAEPEEMWDFDDVDEMKIRYPKLVQRFHATYVPNALENQKIMKMLSDAGLR